MTIPQGYYDGTRTATASDSALLNTNILIGKTIFGIAGSVVQESHSNCSSDNSTGCIATATYPTQSILSSPAAASEVLSGKQFYAGSALQTGTMVNQGGFDASVSFPGAGYYSGATSNLPTGSQIASGSTILGISGTYLGSFSANTGSNALRDPGSVVVPQFVNQATSQQLTLAQEVSTYEGADLPTTGGYGYRDIPDVTKDDEAYSGINCNYASRPSVDCGKNQTTINLRIADCAALNPSTSSWDGATKCNRGQGRWSLVTRSGANTEVWRDERTGLIWSSRLGTLTNWCQASGNTQESPVTFTQAYNTTSGTPITGNGTISSISGGSSSLGEIITITFSSAITFSVTSTFGSGCNSSSGANIVSGTLTTSAGSSVVVSKTNYCSFTITQGSTRFAANDKIILTSTAANTYSCNPGAGSGLQSAATPRSFCAEASGLSLAATDSTSAYLAAKGHMGSLSMPSVRWRLPNLEDYEQANVDGIRMVMPDLGAAGTERPQSDGSTGSSAAPTIEWTSSVVSFNRICSWYFTGSSGLIGNNVHNISTYAVRCVGR